MTIKILTLARKKRGWDGAPGALRQKKNLRSDTPTGEGARPHMDMGYRMR
jgi:hypothetical protein